MFDAWLSMMMAGYVWQDGRKGLTPQELAHGIDVKEATVSRWLSGQRTPERAQVAALSVFFRVNPEVILRITDPDILKGAIAEIEQHGVSAVLSTVPELGTLLEDIAKLPPERRAALIVLIRGLTEG